MYLQEYILLNGKTLKEINAETDTSSYVFSTFPSTAAAIYQIPVIVLANNGALELKVHNDYVASLGENLDIRPWGQWEEAYALENWCKDNRQALLEARAEITRLNTALDYARDAEEYRKQLISNITHELKTPLAVVHSYTEGLQSEIAPEKKERYLQVILDEAERMDGMVMQMLELSRLEAGRVKLKMEYFDLGAVIRDVAERFEPLMAEKELKLRLELGGQEQMNGDEGRIEQVITNFMSNAVKYSTPGGEILVKAVFGKLGLYFSITNNAKHLSEEGLQKVFDSFYREDAARTEKSTGLGLAIVKNIMNLHGFQCYVNNTMLNDQPAVEFGFRRE
jgi:signal transduction histidine kinase